MFIDDTGIVLQVVRYDDRSSIVHVFTRSHGTVSFMVTRPRSRSSAGAAVSVLLSPLAVLAFQWDMKPQGTLYRLRDVHASPVWRTLPYHPVKRALALMLAESLAAMLREEGENTELFDHVVRSLSWLDDADEGFANFHLVFLLGTARTLGVAPDTSGYVRGQMFDIDSALFVPYAAASPYVMQPTDADALYRLCLTDYARMADDVRLSHNDRSRLLTYLNRFFTRHLPAFPQLKSPDILDSVFND